MASGFGTIKTVSRLCLMSKGGVILQDGLVADQTIYPQMKPLICVGNMCQKSSKAKSSLLRMVNNALFDDLISYEKSVTDVGGIAAARHEYDHED